ncbi:hypothetical protein BDB01DRAFT_839969 [Pilobolus umbonatus]|nr:hypothetical protein BDB01DRAFT_839969 [Pilobolus umbonatus]
MGVSGLTKYMDDTFTRAETKVWKQAADLFIIDGNAFIGHYMRVFYKTKMDWYYSDNTQQALSYINSVVRSMQEGGTLIFLFDGAIPSTKIPTKRRRMQANMLNILAKQYVLPTLTFEAIVDHLISKPDVEVHMVKEEADSVVAYWAEQRNGYAVSKDSDMFVFPKIGRGYIPLDTLEFTPGQMTGRIFHPLQLALSLGWEDTQYLPLLGTLMGNDHIVRPVIQKRLPAQRRVEWAVTVAKCIQQHHGDIPRLARALGLDVSQVQYSVEGYQPQSSEVYSLSRQILNPLIARSFWANVQVEDMDAGSSWWVSTALRQAMYSCLLGKGEMIEYHRDKLHVEMYTVPFTGDVGSRDLAYFLRCHVSDTIPLGGLQADVRLMVICIRYFIYHAYHTLEDPLSPNEIKALILSFQHQHRPVGHAHARSLHLAAQFQSILLCSHYLSQVLNLHLYRNVLATLFHGSVFHYYTMNPTHENVENYDRIITGLKTEIK